ncbi:MAG: TRAP transporter small permease [Candidatus Goldbacteria bacterium]|nr:TRAP transporter small permease [Candidatus Goldiibacteriota bacterium]
MLKAKIIKIDSIIYKIETKFVFFMLLIMIILSFLQIILRLVFNNSIAEIEIIIRNIVMIGCLFASSIVTYNGSHFRIEIIEKFIKKPKKLILLKIISQIFVIIASVIIFIEALNFIEMDIGIKKTIKDLINFNFQSSQIVLLLPIIFFNMTLHSIISILKIKELK